MKAGTLFFFRAHTYKRDDDMPEWTELRLWPVGTYEHEGVSPNESAATRQLEECLRRVDDTPSLYLKREHYTSYGLGVLDLLFNAGKVTMAEVIELSKAYEDRDDLEPVDSQEP